MRDHSVTHVRGGARRGWKTIWTMAAAALTLPVLVVGTTGAAHAAGGTALADFRVEDSQSGAQITHYKWLVNLDNTGDPSFTAQSIKDCLPDRAGDDPRLAGASGVGGSLAACPWPSTRAVPGDSPVIASGTDADVARLTELSTLDVGNGPGNGKYLISVTARDFKIDGVHFEVKNGVLDNVNEDPVGPTVPFTVKMNPMPLQTATVRVHVYNDNASTNGQWDGQTETLLTCADPGDAEPLPAGCHGVVNPNWVADPETDMSGFTVTINDVLSTVTTDVFGNPLCTEYQMQDGKVYLDEFGSPVPVSFGSTLGGTESSCISDHYGDVVIPNLGPNRYAASITPPDSQNHESVQWVQTTTLEGGHDWDTWNQEGGSGYDTELVVGGERVTPVAHGFVKLTTPDAEYQEMINEMGPQAAAAAYYDASAGFSGGAAGHGVLTGRIRIGRAYIGSGAGVPLAGVNLANAKEDGPIEDGLISINCIATCNAPTDSAVWVGRSNPDDGSFTVTGLQTGDYTVSFWDEAQSYILAVMQYHVEGDQIAVPNDLGAVTSATRTGTGTQANPYRYFLNFQTAPTIPANTQLIVTSSTATGNRNWTGTFNVLAVNGNQVEVRKAAGPQPSGTHQNPAALSATYTTYTDPVPTDVHDVLLPGWFTDLTGKIFVDDNENGIQDPGEAGIPDFGVTVRTRGNSLQDQGAAASTTGEDGSYDLSQAYPLGQFLIFEAYNPRYYTTGYNYSTDNDPTPHVVVGTGQVDFNFLPIIGLSGKINVGVKPYGQFENGGIAGTVSYDVTRNEFDPAFSAAEDYQPSIPGLPVQLWKTKKNADGSVAHYAGSGAVVQIGTTAGGAECERPDTARGTDALTSGDQTCFPFDYYVTEHWTRPTGCVALDVNGNPLQGELVLPDAPANWGTADYDWSHSDPANEDCVEAPMNGMQIGGDGSVNGNYALSNLITPTGIAAGAAGGVDGLLAMYGSDHGDTTNWSATLPPDDYVVEVVNPVDELGGAAATDVDEGGYVDANTPKHLYRFTDETSINVFTGDTYEPQEGVVQPVSTPEGDPAPLAPFDPSVERQDLNTIGAGTVALCGGTMQTVQNNQDADNYESDFTGGGGSPFDGQPRPVCDAKVVKVVNGRSVAPTFFMYTDVPIPSKFYGLVNDDLNVQTDRRSVLLGEVAPVSNAPVGVYDELGRWKYTAHSDVNGNYEVLLPSMDTYNCPLPAGPCPNVYRLVGNDPGTLFHRNTDYDPQFRTIATNFQAWTGVIHPVDQAPTHIGITIEGPAAQFGARSLCKLNDPANTGAPVTPELFSINRPYYDPGTDNGSTQFVLKGFGFGANGDSQVQLDGTGVSTTWVSDRELHFTVPTSLGQGAHQLSVKRSNGLSTVNGITFHRLSPAGSNPTYLQRTDVYEVRSHSDYANPASVITNDSGRTFTPMHDPWDATTNTPGGFTGTDVSGNGVTGTGGRAIQRAVNAAYSAGNNGNNAKLVVIYPNEAPNYANFNANAAYFENVVLHGRVMLQGVGTGGVYGTTEFVHGTAIDASTFWAANGAGTNPQAADGSYSDDWRTFANGIARPDTEVADLPEGEAVLAIAESTTQWANLQVDRGPNRTPRFVDAFGGTPSNRKNGVDGMLITGGDQQGNPAGVVDAPGTVGGGTTAGGNPGPAQGGAIMLDRYVRDFRITNNLIESNGGTYGAVRIGTPDLPNQDNHNERPVIMSNRFVANGGTNLAGALGLFFGADLYKVQNNDFCGNFSAEYGGAISHYGSSPGGTIDHNRIYYNQSYDEGGAVFIAGNLPANTNGLSLGAGGTYVVSVSNNSQRTINSSAPTGVTVDANVIVSNQSNDDGGGVRFLMAGNFPFTVSNNMIANNLATHEGGGIALDDTPNVSIISNTVVKNITTGTAATNSAVQTVASLQTGAIVPAGTDVTLTPITQDPGPAVRPQNPAGLATGGNSPQLQNTLPNHSPNWSKPTLVNNLFADNRAGWAETPTTANFNQNAIHAIGAANSSDTEQRWDIGMSSKAGLCDDYDISTHACVSGSTANFGGTTNTTNTSDLDHTPTNAGVYLGTDNIDGNGGLAGDGTQTIKFAHAVDFLVDSLGWRVNTNVSFPVIVAQMVPVTLLADYHLADDASTTYAVGVGTAPAGCPAAGPWCVDIDRQTRGAGTDRGADEIVGAQADLTVTKDDGKTTTTAGATNTYTITVHNSGPSTANGVTVTDTLPAALTGASWTCAGSCAPGAASGTGNINTTVNLANGATATYTLTATVAAAATGSVTNTATVSSAVADPNPADNTATDSDTIPPPRPTLTVLDTFTRNNSTALGANWSVSLATAQVGANSYFTTSTIGNFLGFGQAMWTAGAVPGAKQAAAFTMTNTNAATLILKGTGGTAAAPASAVLARVTTGGVEIRTTTNRGINTTTLDTFATTIVAGDRITVQIDAAGRVDVWRTTSANVTTWLGTTTSTYTGTGRIGITISGGGRVDDFAAGTVAP